MIEPVDQSQDLSRAVETPLLPAILDAVADGITVQDSTGRVVYANATALRMIGFGSLAELLDATPAEILGRFDLLDESGAELSPRELPGRHALQGVDPGPMVVGYRLRSTGEIFWSQLRATPLRDLDGRVTHAINTFHDVTSRLRAEADLRASEASYRHLVEAMPQVAWTTDADGRLELVNERWRQYTGDTEALGHGVDADARVHPADLPELSTSWATSVTSGEPLDATVRLRRHDGAYRWHLVRAVPVRRADGAIGGWIGTSTDIDDERRSRSASTLLAAAAERLDESLDPAHTARAAAELAVPHLGDWAVVELTAADGSTRRAATAGEGWEVDRGDSALSVPLTARGETLGAMAFGWRDERRHEPADVALAEDLGRRAALAISNAALYAAEQSARETAEATAARMESLQRMTRLLAAASDRGEVARIATHEAAPALGARAAVLVVANADGMLEIVGAHGYSNDGLATIRVLSPDDPLPIARAFRERRPIWAADASREIGADERVETIRADRPNKALAAIPLIVGERVVGALGLAFQTAAAFAALDRDLTVAQANVVAQAIDRLALTDSRERLLVDLEAQRNRLETVLRQMPAGVLIADESGTLVLSNRQSAEIWRAPIPTDRLVSEYVEYVARRPDGHELAADEWPLVRALSQGEVISGELLEIDRFDGTRGWITVDAAPVRDRDGAIVAAVSTFDDVTDQRIRAQRQSFLAEASAVLASSLDYEETLRGVASLAVPAIADWAMVDLVDDTGSLDRLVVVHSDPSRVELAKEFRRRFPPDPDAPTGVAAVVRTGQAEYIADITDEMIDRLPELEQRAMIRQLHLNSYMAVPLMAGGEILGAITFVGAESGRRFDPEDLRLAENLAQRAGGAIQNARLFRDVGRFKAILDATLDAVFMFDPDVQHIVYANQGAFDQLGWDATELLAMAPRELIDDIDQARLRALVTPIVDGRTGSRTVTLRLRHRDGRRVPVEVLLQYVELAPEAGRVVAIARDISDRVEAQARLQRLAEAEHARAAELNAVIRAMGDGLIVVDGEGDITLVNPAAEVLFARPGSRTWAALLAQLDGGDAAGLALGERGGPVELRVAGETERWIELSTYPVGSTDDPLGSTRAPETIVLVRDVSEAKQRQAVRDTFIGVLSHELRTPVTTIYAGSKVLSKGGLSEEMRRSVFEDIHVEAERLHRLVEDVIALTRFGESDESETGKEPVLLQRILPAVVRSEEARWPGVTFELAVPGGIPTVVADPTYVEQVVRNLLSNAAKYGGAGSTVTATVENGTDEVIVRILDDGPGFPPDEADRLFELFFRSPSTSGHASGAGIGLFVCARLIRAMQGRIWARARPEGGAEFGFALGTMAED